MLKHLTRGTQLMAIYQDQYRPYFYIIQDVRNGMYYAGAKWGKDANPSNFMVEGGYTTSSNTIKKLIQQYGLDNFIIRKIRIFETPNETCYYETRFLEKVGARKNKKFYNLHNNDNIFDTEKMCFVTEMIYGEGIVNISQTSYWKEITREKKDSSLEKRRKTIDETWDEEFRDHLKKKKQESWKISPKREEHSKKTKDRRIKEEASKTEEQKKDFGKKVSDAYWNRPQEKIVQHQMNRTKSIKQSYDNNPELRKLRSDTTKGRITVTKDGKNKRLRPDEVDGYLKQGWLVGSSTKGKKVSNRSCLGKKAVNKNGTAKYVPKSEVDDYLLQGWKLGLK
jgi:hypothetical protein